MAVETGHYPVIMWKLPEAASYSIQLVAVIGREMELQTYNSPIDIVRLLSFLIWPMFKCVCLTREVGLPWKPLPFHHIWCSCVVSAFVAMKVRIMPWSLYSSKGSWEKCVDIAVGICICSYSSFAISTLACAGRDCNRNLIHKLSFLPELD